MSIQVANIDLSSAAVGQTGVLVSLEKLLPPPTISQQMRPTDIANVAHLVILNESGCQLLLTLPTSNQTKTLAAGRWMDLAVPPHESAVNYTVQAVATGVFHSLLADFYWPGEPVEELGVLGNSPIGGQSALGTQVIQDGQPNAQVIVEATPTGQPQNVLIKTDGTIILAGMTAFYGGLFGSFNATLFEPSTPNQAGVNVNGQVFAIWNGSALKNILAIGSTDGRNAATMLGPLGQFTQVASQAATGSFGVPVLVAQALDVNVTVTTGVTILSYTPTVTGHYRVSAYVHTNVAATFDLEVDYTDDHSGVAENANFGGVVSTSPGFGRLTATPASPSGIVPIAPQVVKARANTAITVLYQRVTAAPNDFVSAFIERLA